MLHLTKKSRRETAKPVSAFFYFAILYKKAQEKYRIPRKNISNKYFSSGVFFSAYSKDLPSMGKGRYFTFFDELIEIFCTYGGFPCGAACLSLQDEKKLFQGKRKRMPSLASTPQKLCPGQEVSFPSLEKAVLPASFTTRKARVQDVNGMSTLINEFASTRIMLPRGPLYLYQNIQDYRVITVMVEEKEVVVACGGLHVLWEDLAEVRSVAVHPQLQRRGVGRIMVQDLIGDARSLGVAHLFTFTLSPEFFSSFGFRTVERESLSPVVWAECSKCPKFYKCDEVGMMLHF